MVKKKHQNPEGGLNEAGRKYYNKKTGSNLNVFFKKYLTSFHCYINLILSCGTTCE